MHISQSIQLVLSFLFPHKTNKNRSNFDFSKIPPGEFTCSNPASLILDKNKKIIVWICLSYKNTLVRSLIWNIKNNRDKHSLSLAGSILSQKLAMIIKDIHSIKSSSNTPILIPIPISRERRRERGYNQCELLVRQIHCNFYFEIKTDILFRIKQKNIKSNNKKQAFKKRTERILGMKGAFEVRFKKLKKVSDFKSRPIILVDDVITTGSTLHEAITALQKIGCENITGLALAH